MSKIKIHNFGPINEGYADEDGYIDIAKVTVFIGNQGTGKSTIAKLISIFMWVEKALNRGDISSVTNAFFHNQFKYHRIYDYLNAQTTIEYHGDRYTIRYSHSEAPPVAEITEGANYHVPKIMYVPAERNFLSVIDNANEIIKLPESLFTFAIELKNSEREYANQEVLLPIPNTRFRYDEQKDISELIGQGYKLKLADVSSGFQSMVPLYLVSKYLSGFVRKEQEILRELIDVNQYIRRDEEIRKIVFDKSLTVDERDTRIREIDSKYISSCFVNIVEEPEQNLFPESQWEILQSLLAFNNSQKYNKLIITTHSPFLINYLTIATQGFALKAKIERIVDANKQLPLLAKWQEIFPSNATVASNDVAIYEIDENGVITKLPMPQWIPSDNNLLNNMIMEGNKMFDQLLDIEEELGA